MTSPAESRAKTGPSFARVAQYFFLVAVLTTLRNPLGGIPTISIAFVLKEHFRLTPASFALMQVVFAIPCYGALLFGIARDLWSPFGRGDRGYLAAFGLLGAMPYLLLSRLDTSLEWFVGLVLVTTCISTVLDSAFQGMVARNGVEGAMTGRLSALVQTTLALLIGASFLGSGWLEANVGPRPAFLWAATASLLLLPVAIWRRREVLGSTVKPRERHLKRQFLQIAMSKSARVPAVIWLLWQFAPVAFTASFYRLTKDLGANPQQYAWFLAILFLAAIPGNLLYGHLCQRVEMKRLLWVVTILAVPQWLPALFMSSPRQAYIAIALVGLLGGLATSAYYDLILRSAPTGLEGTVVMLSGTAFFVASRFGDLLGAWLYEHGGYGTAVWATVGVYSLIPIALANVSDELIQKMEGQVATVASSR